MDKPDFRKALRAGRRAHVAALDDGTRALLFRRPPGPVLDLLPSEGAIGLYRATPYEAPGQGYASFLQEAGRELALPWFADRGSPMSFRRFTDPLGESDLKIGPFGLLQPAEAGEPVIPSALFVPLLGFTAAGERIGQGGGHYDRWIAEHPETVCIGLAWDSQLVEELPLEPHDRRLQAIVTPTRFYGPFDA